MKRLLIISMVLLLNLFVFGIRVNADTGPKPSLHIIANNMPDEMCYMDLLINYSSDHNYQNIDDLTGYNENMINALKQYSDDEWRPAMITGTRVPLHGNIICDIQNGSSDMHYSYVGVPDLFKIIVVTQSNQIVVSDVIERKAFQSTVYFDFKSGDAYEKTLTSSYVSQFSMTLISTIIIELLVLLLFGFSVRKNFKTFILVNVFTQVLLTGVVLRSMLLGGTLTALIGYFVFEIVIIGIEMMLFSRFLSEHNKLRRKVYALVANLASFGVGLLILLYI